MIFSGHIANTLSQSHVFIAKPNILLIALLLQKSKGMNPRRTLGSTNQHMFCFNIKFPYFPFLGKLFFLNVLTIHAKCWTHMLINIVHVSHTPMFVLYRWSVLCQADAVQGICDHAGSLSAALREENGWPSLYSSLDGGNLLVSSYFVSIRYVHVPLLIAPHYSCECLIRLTSHKIKSSRRQKQTF